MNIIFSLRRWFPIVVIPLLASCAAPTLRNQFRNYNEAYAESLNQQMLLNLARAGNGHPVYYLAIGSIQNNYTFASQTTAGTTGSFTDQQTTTQNRGASGSIVSRVLTTISTTLFGYNFNQSVTATSNPQFTFIPINNEAAARQVLEPISTDVFLELYQQGYPIDQLMRVMIERIETPRLQTGEHLLLVNSPSSGAPAAYERFLSACAMLRTLQTDGYLSLEVYDNLHNHKRGVPKFFLKQATEIAGTNLEAMAALMNSDANTSVDDKADEHRKAMANIASLANATIDHLKSNPSYNNPHYYSTITNTVYALCFGISIQTDVSSKDDSSVRLVLRSFNRTMEVVASEQAGFEAVKKKSNFAEMVPDLERRPVLQMIWTNKSSELEPPLAILNYSNKTYQITDPVVKNPLSPVATWNRDVFRLLVDLSSQVTVDISKFQRQVLQLEP
jgi:hypothetical protein